MEEVNTPLKLIQGKGEKGQHKMKTISIGDSIPDAVQIDIHKMKSSSEKTGVRS